MKQLFWSLCFVLGLHAGYQDLHTYMWANYQYFGGKKSKAENLFNKLIKTQHSPVALKGYIHFLQDAGKLTQIISYKDAIDRYFQKDPDVQLMLANALRQLKERQEEGDDRLVRLSRTFPEHPEIILQTTQILMQRKEVDNALNVLNTFLLKAHKRPNLFMFHFLKAQIHLQLQQIKEARESVRACVSIQPYFPQAWLMYALLEEKEGDLSKSIEGYKEYLRTSGAREPRIEHHLVELNLQLEKFEKETALMLKNQPAFKQAGILYTRKQYDRALTAIDKALEGKPKDLQAQLLKIEILKKLEKEHEAIKALTVWAKEAPNEKLIDILYLFYSSHSQAVLQALLEINQQKPDHAITLLYLIDTLLRNDQTDKAVSYLEKAEKIKMPAEYKGPISFQYARLLYEKEQFDRLKNLIVTVPRDAYNYPPLMNLIAYYAAEKERDYQKAERLIKKVLAYDSGNPHYLDTKAFILYRQGKHSQAYDILKKLAVKEPDDGTIMMHLGKLSLKLGMIDDAQEQLKKAHTVVKHANKKVTIEKWLKRIDNQDGIVSLGENQVDI